MAADPAALESGFAARPESLPARRGPHGRSADWEERHGYRLPAGLRAWLMLSNGLFGTGPLIHPISAIGPMIPFARVPDLIVQPESWFELGNPNLQTVCIDLAYRLPRGGFPIFTSGDDASHSPPRIIARSFEEWFLELLRQGGREYWFDPDFSDFGDPWQSHRAARCQPPVVEKAPAFSRTCRTFTAVRDRRASDRRGTRSDPARSRVDLPSSSTRQPRSGAVAIVVNVTSSEDDRRCHRGGRLPRDRRKDGEVRPKPGRHFSRAKAGRGRHAIVGRGPTGERNEDAASFKRPENCICKVSRKLAACSFHSPVLRRSVFVAKIGYKKDIKLDPWSSRPMARHWPAVTGRRCCLTPGPGS